MAGTLPLIFRLSNITKSGCYIFWPLKFLHLPDEDTEVILFNQTLKLRDDREYYFLLLGFIIHKCLSSEGYIDDQDEGYISGGVVALMLKEDEDTICTNDTSCSSNTTCINNTICTITFWADKYNPDLDWGEFSVVVSQGNTSSRQSVMVDAEPRLLVLVQPLSASVYKVRMGRQRYGEVTFARDKHWIIGVGL